MSNATVHYREVSAHQGHIGIATLDAPSSLNALSLDMIHSLTKKLIEWNLRPEISCVFLEGAGEKAFCAGGDIVRLYESMQGDRSHANDFFLFEYSLDLMIHQYPKPLIVWGHGIIMGGGLGLMAGAPLRIVTENAKVAMPEITIGLYPEVGASYFLNQMPGHCGLYLGLTGTRMSYEDCLYLGLADHHIPHAKKAELLHKLELASWSENLESNMELARTLIHTLSEQPVSKGEVSRHQEFINESLTTRRLDQIEKFFRQHQQDDAWINQGVTTFLKGSPTSAHVILEQLFRSQGLSIEAAFENELGMSEAFAMQHDFKEGIRALLIEKDHAPRWNPASRDDVTTEHINRHFKKSERKILHYLERH